MRSPRCPPPSPLLYSLPSEDAIPAVWQALRERAKHNPGLVSAKNDHPTQIVLEMARDVDRSGHKTLGIIRKHHMLTSCELSRA
jgi:CRISPR/Cas system Type II protein with McrA/HNH and RuvC-like nuclease domain